jgi:hypothetical protein
VNPKKAFEELIHSDEPLVKTAYLVSNGSKHGSCHTGGIHVICVSVLTDVLTLAPPNPLLTVKFIGNKVEWRKGRDYFPQSIKR